MQEVIVDLVFLVFYLVISTLITQVLIGFLKTLNIKLDEKHMLAKRLITRTIQPLRLFLITGITYIGLKTYNLFLQYQILIDAIFFIILIISGTVILSRTTIVFANFAFKKNQHLQKAPHLIGVTISAIIFTISGYIILKYFGIEVTPYLATLGIGGVAVGLALQGTLSNFFAGLHILSDKPINVGDYIEIDEQTAGWVEDIGSISTRVKTLTNTLIIIPNNKIANSIITNDSLPFSEINFRIPVGVSYESDLEKVEKVTIEVAKKIQETIPGAVKNFEPFIRYNEFADSNINFNVILRVERMVDKFPVRHEFIKALKARYDKEKIEISWPVRKIVKA